MFAVIFEVRPREQRFDDYLTLAKQLKPKLEAIDGFIDVERFASKRTKGRILSLSAWRDEKSVVRWRSHPEHHDAQELGRFEIFEDYRLRVGEITADTQPPKGLSVEQTRFDETEVGEAKVATITEITPGRDGRLRGKPDLLPMHVGLDAGANGIVEYDVFESIYEPGKLLLLVSWRNARAAGGWSPGASPAANSVRHRQVQIIRDYGMFDRREAPQFHPDVAAAGAARRNRAATR